MVYSKRKRPTYKDSETDLSESDEEYIPPKEKSSLKNLKNLSKLAYNNLLETKQEILKTEPTLIKILEEPMLISDRVQLFQLYEIYKLSEPSTQEWLSLRNNVNILFDQCKNNYIEHTKYTKTQHNEMENQFSLLEKYNKTPDLKYTILQLNTTLENKQTIYSRYKEFQTMTIDDIEKGKLKHWINWAIDIPHDNIKTVPFSKNQLTQFLRCVSDTLDKELYGMKYVKEQLLLFVSSKIQNPHMKRCSIGLIGKPGVGKCLGKDTPIIMYDGSIKMVQHIKSGDKIMGDDSTPRNVLSICSGKETLYLINQSYGDNYIVNESHIISLKLTKNPSIKHKELKNTFQVNWYTKEKYNSKIFKYSGKSNKNNIYNQALIFMETLPKKDSIIDIDITTYIKRPKKWKLAYKGFKTSVDFNIKNVELDPYLLGLWLGCDSEDEFCMSIHNCAIIKYLQSILPKYNCYLQYKGNYNYKISGTKYTNKVLDLLKKYNLINNKHIPNDYLINSKTVRLQLLAGLIDSNGYKFHNYYEIIQKQQQLSKHILFLTRSLGFKSVITDCKQKKTYKIVLSGPTNLIPILLDNKKQIYTKTKLKTNLSYDITIQKLEIGDYYGFTIDGNHRFLLGDFTVTHNTAISRLLASVLNFPFEQISMGGISNPDYLKGHEYTYIGAQPGEIVKCLKRMKYKNGILFLDEFDKISDNKDICSALLHITDPMQNFEFRDKFLSDITIDLSYIWFIYSMNEYPEDVALSDRIYTIEVPGYEISDKKCIIKNYLFPKALKNINVSENSITISDTLAEYIVKEKTDYINDVGVRSLEKIVNNIVNKINFIVNHQDKNGKLTGFNLSFDMKRKIKYPVELTKDIVDKFC